SSAGSRLSHACAAHSFMYGEGENVLREDRGLKTKWCGRSMLSLQFAQTWAIIYLTNLWRGLRHQFSSQVTAPMREDSPHDDGGIRVKEEMKDLAGAA